MFRARDRIKVSQTVKWELENVTKVLVQVCSVVVSELDLFPCEAAGLSEGLLTPPSVQEHKNLVEQVAQWHYLLIRDTWSSSSVLSCSSSVYRLCQASAAVRASATCFSWPTQSQLDYLVLEPPAVQCWTEPRDVVYHVQQLGAQLACGVLTALGSVFLGPSGSFQSLSVTHSFLFQLLQLLHQALQLCFLLVGCSPQVLKQSEGENCDFQSCSSKSHRQRCRQTLIWTLSRLFSASLLRSCPCR